VLGEALRLLSKKSVMRPAMTLTTAPSSKGMPLKRYSVVKDISFSFPGISKHAETWMAFHEPRDKNQRFAQMSTGCHEGSILPHTLIWQHVTIFQAGSLVQHHANADHFDAIRLVA